MPSPNVFIVGAPKCGTTSLVSFFKMHPDVYVPRLKEPHFLSQDLQWSNEWGLSNEEAYQGLYSDSIGEKCLIDASTWYLYSENACNSIARNPDSKVIVLVRNPLEFMHSLWWHLYSRGKETACSFSDALALEPLRATGTADYSPAPFRQCVLYQECARFSIHIKRYFDAMGYARVRVYTIEEILNNPSSSMRDIEDFLEIRNMNLNIFPASNVAIKARFTAVKIFLQKYPLIKDLYYSNCLRLFRILLQKRAFGEGKSKPILSIDSEQILNNVDLEIDRLESLLGRNLGVLRN